MVDRFLDKELFNESFFTFAKGLVKKEINVSSYRLFYNRGEKTAFSRSPYMWILVYADKAALIRAGYISQRTREEPFIGAKYWICNFDNSDIQETKFVNCKKGKNVPSLILRLFLWLVKLKMMANPTLFVPTLPRVKSPVIQKDPIILELKVINFIFVNNNVAQCRIHSKRLEIRTQSCNLDF
ncbi:hypothetical protein MY480_03405 [Leptospira borgpetersenii]|nr:hypothetical protein MY480_03405 [Leptospira borgpetersenii]